jgi:hypothetical protein
MESAGVTSKPTRVARGKTSRRRPSPLCHQLAAEKVYSCRVATRPVEAFDKAQLDGVFADAEDDRDCRGRILCCAGGKWETGCDDDRNPTTNQVGGEHR